MIPTLPRAARLSANVTLMLLAFALAACGTTAAPRTSAPAEPATGGGAPTMAKAPTSVSPQPMLASEAGPGADPRALGDPSAPITIVEYSDYQ